MPKFTRIQRITIIVFVIVVINWTLTSTIGYRIAGGDLFEFFLVLFLILLGIQSFRPVTRWLLWRVRSRLLFTYFLVGVVPIVLIGLMLAIGSYLLIGQTTAYLVKVELDRELDRLSRSAFETNAKIQIIPKSEWPAWAKPGFKGVIRRNEKFFLAAHGIVLAYEPLDAARLAQFLPGLARIGIVASDDVVIRVGREDQMKGLEIDRNPELNMVEDSAKIATLPESRGFWDREVSWGTPVDAWMLEREQPLQIVLIVSSRPSLILARLFGTYKDMGVIIGMLLAVLSAVFVFVEIASVLWTAGLTRSITRTVHDLYEGTKRVEVGDFSHRIPIRTKDQLSTLATSFNSMTAHIQQLIEEVKEKEKLEAELFLCCLL